MFVQFGPPGATHKREDLAVGILWGSLHLAQRCIDGVRDAAGRFERRARRQ